MNNSQLPKITIGIPAYNEEKDIGKVILAVLRQKGNFKIEKIIVFSDCSIDNTAEIVRDLSKKNKTLQLICEKKRKGKMALINKFMNIAKTQLVIIANGDCLPSTNAIAELLKKMEPGVGLVGPKAVCLISKKPRLAEKITKILWDWHHKIALDSPKLSTFILTDKEAVGELNPFCPVDEPLMEAEALRRGYKIAYAPKAKIFIKPPSKMSDYFSQRRRIHFGYYLMRQDYKEYSPPTMNFRKLFSLFKKQLFSTPAILIAAAIIELVAKFIGWLDFITGKKNSGVWKIATSSKGLGRLDEE